jgi:hypothetical protein
MRTMQYLAVFCLCFATASAFIGSYARLGGQSVSNLQMADVDIVFPGNKKVKAAGGSAMKDGNAPDLTFT